MRWSSVFVVFLCGHIAVFPGVLSDCSDPGQIDNGNRTVTLQPPSGPKPFGEWSMVEYTCNDGFTISGARQAFCQNGAWSSNQPMCKADCRDEPELTNGYVLEGNFPLSGTGGRATLSCNDGYTLAGVSEIACIDGSFGTYTTICQKNCGRPDLGDLRTIVSGFPEDVESVSSGTTITYGCVDGYSVVGPNQGTCNDAVWNYIAACVEDCPVLEVENARLNSDAKHSDAVVRITCRKGFQPTGDFDVRCANSVWSGTIPDCVDEFADYILAYYPFENDFNDHGRYGYNGVNEGPVMFAENMGISGTGASFVGNGRVDVANDFNNFTHFSVSLWFKRTGDWDSYQGVVSMGGYDEIDGLSIMMGDEENGQTLYAGLVTETKSEPYDYVNMYAAANRWHHLATSYDGAQFHLYLDGVKQIGGEDCCHGYIVPGYAPIRIGQAGPPIAKQYFHGLIDEVYVLDIAIDDSQATTLYERDERKCTDPSLLLHLDFENGFRDSSCYGWDGVPYGDVVAYDGEAMFYGKGQINIEEFTNYAWGSAFTVTFRYACSSCKRQGETPSEYPETTKGLITNGLHSPGSFELSLQETDSGTYLTGGVGESGYHNKRHESMVDDNDWQHVAFVFNGTESYLYRGDATSKRTFDNREDHLSMKNSPVTIGVTGSGDVSNAHYFQGRMDDIKIFNRALGGDELF